VVAETVAPPPLSAHPENNRKIDWEAIVGAGVWGNNLARGNWQYGEGAITTEIGDDGYAIGVGAYGMHGSGHSKGSDYRWNEGTGIGPQLVLKRNFLKEHKDEFGQTVELPAGWQLKLRSLHDWVSGGNPTSGYNLRQTGKKLGLYGEYAERTSIDWIWGGNAEVWKYSDGNIHSTWSGDLPQDRGSYNANIYGQYRVNDDWQAKGIVGGSHQNWDKLNLLSLTLEARYKETVMFGPRVSFAMNHPEAYTGTHIGPTIGAFVRVELGDTLRAFDQKQRQESVTKVGPPVAPRSD
jgi:hypothetical protein